MRLRSAAGTDQQSRRLYQCDKGMFIVERNPLDCIKGRLHLARVVATANSGRAGEIGGTDHSESLSSIAISTLKL